MTKQNKTSNFGSTERVMCEHQRLPKTHVNRKCHLPSSHCWVLVMRFWQKLISNLSSDTIPSILATQSLGCGL